MTPPFNHEGNLPAGVHSVDFNAFSKAFGGSTHRRRLLTGLEAAMIPLKMCGCLRLYVDGSFVTIKEFPNDYDVAWEPSGVDLAELNRIEPVSFDFRNLRAAQKAKFFGEFFPSSVAADPAGNTFFEFFQIDKSTGNPKGIIALDL